MMSAGAAGAAGAIAAAEAFRQVEEEEMTPYSDKDLAEGWEFKILRSAMGAFRKPEQLRAVLDEEKRGGWILVEKFDDTRIRLKRPAGAKLTEADLAEGYDPYRTTVGPSAERQALVIVAVTVIALLVTSLLVIVMTR
jgi:hypothetical protein